MSNIIIGILLFLTFIGFIVFVMRGGNIMIGFLIMAVLWTVIGGIPYKEAINDIFSQPAMDYGSTIMVIIFGSWFGRVLVDTGVAGAISEQAVKVSYKHPISAAILVCLITAFIFTSSYGVGAVIAIAVILLPILQSLGLSKNVAVVAFVMSIGAPMYVNIVIIKQIQLFFPKVIYGAKYLTYGFSAMAVQMIVVILFILVHAKSIHKNEVTSTDVKDVNISSVPKISYILPVFPVLMNLIFGWQPIPALMLSIFLVLLTTGHLKTYKNALSMINQTVSKAISDISGLIVMLLFLTMFSAAAVKNTARFGTILKSIVPHDPFILAIAFGVLAPLALFRGPLMVWGAGSATAAVLAATGFFNQYFAFCAIIVPAVSIAISTCITQSWNLWVVEHTELNVKDFLKTGVPYGWLTSIINLLLAAMMFH
ncbi:MAG: gluconate:proton symporter [Lentilactobacillus hilgardii]|uniref:gluconate:proton symporter n=1 Tax=Lentilactobacillus hilgardii TaxID=1588 RepID=UPI001CC1F4C1|nr:gluconate:proton symporter [Lentilactobacillus hilgardii]MBZ2201796.1 gluconate:proton symporter [Lentilactobacillus hilgardii]MBZ2204713.1 gluconate:proton symporter [Lentilactobacillus hilgardii]